MLQSLRIRNLALLEAVDLEFEPGFTAVTGETGAGKSILLGALGLLSGARADKTVLRQGAAACEVEAALQFAAPGPVDALLEELGLPPCEEGMLLLKRSVPRDKPPKILVNGGFATLAALQRLGEAWIDFHGPGEPRRLLKEATQLELLDLFGRAGAARAEYEKTYRAWRALLAERARLTGETRLGPEQLDFLREQLGAMDGLDLSDEAIAALERDFRRLSRSQELAGLTDALASGLTGDEGVQAPLAALLRTARQLEALEPAGRPLGERLAALAVELNDLATEFAALGGEVQFDAEQAADLAERMNVWLELKRKHGGEPAAVRAAREKLRASLEEQGDLEGALARLDGRIAAAAGAAAQEARVLRGLREKAAKELARAAARDLVRLGFQKAEFHIRIVPLAEPGPSGDCACEFLFSPNVGEPPLPLARIASSGELARVMLALKSVLADVDGVPLLVFDEVDANVGGEIGRVVGEKMAAIARRHQVLCVTHLPQVAAQADSHLVVTKDQSTERAVVTIEPIQGSRAARLRELARMLGDRNARSALAHAEELLG